ncbi:MAG: autotransporter outer membrane beta-barrel domain-containing protein [Deltaproteobacteria bacterium]|jgi:hypothetical protein|nr:autotransporter outer membrane beta-barrel domain-containing protein [Deltaproteobacteria bacterium]
MHPKRLFVSAESRLPVGFLFAVAVLAVAAALTICSTAVSADTLVLENATDLAPNTLDAITFGGASKDPVGNGTIGVVVVRGGVPQQPLASGNTVIVRTNAGSRSVIGGATLHAGFTGDAHGNRVIVEGSFSVGELVGTTNRGSVLGGAALAYGAGNYSGDAYQNFVELGTGATVYRQVIGGMGVTGNGWGNTVLIRDAKVGGDVFGGIGGQGACNVSGGCDAYDNFVDIYKVGGVSLPGVGAVSGGSSDYGNSLRNTVVFRDGIVQNQIFGGVTYSVSAADARDNSVIFSGGETDRIYGGVTYSGVAANASGNSVTVSGGKVASAIYGGATNFGQAINNTVTLSGAPVLSGRVYGGGIASAGTPADVFTGNTLKLEQYAGTGALSEIGGFQFIEASLGASAALATAPVLTTDTLNLMPGPGGTAVTRVELAGGSAPLLHPSDKVILIKALVSVNNGFSGAGAKSVTGRQGDLILYDMTYTADLPDGLVLNVNGVRLAPESVALSEGFLAGAAFLDAGFDLVAGEAMEDAVRAAKGAGSERGFRVFAAASYGKNRYDTGSHVDVTGFNAVVGASKAFAIDGGPTLTLGVFGEFGDGEYDTYNDIPGRAALEGEGDLTYAGAGLMLRADFPDTGPGHFHVEAGARFGRADNDFETRGFSGAVTKYSLKSDYFGAFFGVGYFHRATDSLTLDYYARYFWTRVEGGSVRLPAGDEVKFDDMDTHRVRGGVRATLDTGSYAKVFFGLGVDYAFSGSASASAYGMPVREPELKGASGFGELGVVISPENTPFSVEIGVQGSFGKRKGLAGSAVFRFDF